MPRIFKSLYIQVLAAIATGVLLGHFYPSFSVQLKPLGDGFIKLVKLMIAPVIFCTIVTGIAGMQNTKKVGSVGLKAIIYFELVTTLALITGLLVMNIVKPGEGMNVNASLLDAKEMGQYASQAKEQNTTDFILGVIPENISMMTEAAAPLLKAFPALDSLEPKARTQLLWPPDRRIYLRGHRFSAREMPVRII